ncbi:AAA family ATPase [Acanthopleuribacter pedis]|uniref:ATP-binding protein n=1 Tax=Acanthopleuribacter pedis TaxID=442870 RepID=A0A8J7Q6L1_9BACT|nr:ATP-binding protein [Acanthopleuribacter pedis]MBO1321487.1 ATP-binding protein [Acanthopleuribacter pedis]
MLIEFKVRNHGCILEPQHLSMVAKNFRGSSEKEPYVHSVNGLNVLTNALIYGANGSGKSTLIEALAFAQDFVAFSAKAQSNDPDRPHFQPFHFQESPEKTDSEFEFTFIQDGVRYQYGFEGNQERILSEWLFAYPENRAQRWFERFCDDDTGKTHWHFGSRFKGQKATIRDLTRPDALFLSTAVMLNHEQLMPVYNWITDKLIVLRSSKIPPIYTFGVWQDKTTRAWIEQFLEQTDTGIKGLRIHETPVDSLPEMVQPFQAKLEETPPGGRSGHITQIEMSTLHQVNGTLHETPLHWESTGNQKLVALAAHLMEILKNGEVLFVDELHNSWHSLLSAHIIQYFSRKHNPSGAQLISTTHDTSLLSLKELGRDQIWFIERNQKTLASQLYALLEFKPRKEESLERGYLRGRYGAIPDL